MTRASRRMFLGTAARLGAGAAMASVLPRGVAGADSARTHSSGLPGTVAGNGAVGPVDGAASLGAHAAAAGLLYGCAVNMNALATDAAYAALIREQCRIVVAENAMKWLALRPSAGTYSFDQADALVAFAEANRMKIRGHNLAWYRDNPKWLAETATKANARDLLVSHIQTVVGRYAGRMHSWDVVNEAIDVADGRPDGLRNSLWLRLVGADYLELAFQTARDADPEALLTYNDYGMEPETQAGERKRAAVIELLRRMVARRVPVDAVGVQSHISAWPSSADGAGRDVSAAGLRNGAGLRYGQAQQYGAGLMRFIAAARELGLQVFVTEMDVNDRALATDLGTRDAAVAAAYRQYLDLVLADPAVRAVLTWGITDRYTWLDEHQGHTDGRLERPLPFDREERAKPAFLSMRDAFDQRGADSRFRFPS